MKVDLQYLRNGSLPIQLKLWKHRLFTCSRHQTPVHEQKSKCSTIVGHFIVITLRQTFTWRCCKPTNICKHDFCTTLPRANSSSLERGHSDELRTNATS